MIVTGGSGGIGTAIVDSFLADGCHVVDIDIRPPRERGSYDGRLDHVEADLTDVASAEAGFAAADGLFESRSPEVLVCCAAISKAHHALDVAIEDFDRILAVNVRGTFLACQLAGRRMRDGGAGGHIVVITSVADAVAFAGEPVYGITKGAQWSLVQALAIELAPWGIAVNAVAPFAIEVQSYGMASTRDVHDAKAQMLARTPAGRLGYPGEVASAVQFLAQASWVTGQRLVVDGGYLATGVAYPASYAGTRAAV